MERYGFALVALLVFAVGCDKQQGREDPVPVETPQSCAVEPKDAWSVAEEWLVTGPKAGQDEAATALFSGWASAGLARVWTERPDRGFAVVAASDDPKPGDDVVLLKMKRAGQSWQVEAIEVAKGSVLWPDL